jgi:hypothetical protein
MLGTSPHINLFSGVTVYTWELPKGCSYIHRRVALSCPPRILQTPNPSVDPQGYVNHVSSSQHWGSSRKNVWPRRTQLMTSAVSKCSHRGIRHGPDPGLVLHFIDSHCTTRGTGSIGRDTGPAHATGIGWEGLVGSAGTGRESNGQGREGLS